MSSPAPDSKPKATKKQRWIITLKALFAVLLTVGLCIAWPLVSIILAFSTVHSTFYFACWTVFLVGLLLTVCIFLFGGPRKLKRVFLGIFLTPIVCAGAFYAWTWWTVDRFPVMTQEIAWYQYRPFREGNKLVKVKIPVQYALNPAEGFPKLNGAYALYPIYAAMAQGMYPESIAGNRYYLDTKGSDVIY